MPAPISEIWTLILAVLAIRLGILTHRVLPRLREWNIPPAITGGLLIATLVTAAREAFGIEIHFADGIRQTLLLVFFVGVGLSAKFSALFRGGLGVAVICLAIVVVVSLQNLAGVAIAGGFGLDKSLGLFFGSIPFLGGHGTAAAWAQATPAQGLEGALEVGMACATLGLIAGGLVAGPLATWLIGRQPNRGGGTSAQGELSWEQPAPHLSAAELLNSDRWLVITLVIALCLALGEVLRQWAAQEGIVMPGFLAVMAVAVVLTNGADLLRHPVDMVVAELTGTVALRLFLAISMMGLKLWELQDLLLPLLVTLVVQVAIVSLVGLLLVYPLLGRGYQGAVGCGGFIGFAMGAMPVGLGVMNRLTQNFGPAPKAILAVTLAAALFADTANALLVNLGFSLLK
jgi:ESS family glutamate:Na+ symporter